MSTMVKRAISLPKEQDAQLKRISRSRRVPYSRLVQAAIHNLLEKEREARLLAAYEDYYSSKEIRKQSDALVDDFFRLSSEVVK